MHIVLHTTTWEWGAVGIRQPMDCRVTDSLEEKRAEQRECNEHANVPDLQGEDNRRDCGATGATYPRWKAKSSK